MDCKMIVLAVFLFAGVAYAAPSPKAKADAAFITPVVAAAPAVVTATSSQYIARNYNGLAAPYVAAPYVAAPAAIQAVPAVAASPYYTSHYTAYPAYSPYSYASPYVTYV